MYKVNKRDQGQTLRDTTHDRQGLRILHHEGRRTQSHSQIEVEPAQGQVQDTNGEVQTIQEHGMIHGV